MTAACKNQVYWYSPREWVCRISSRLMKYSVLEKINSASCRLKFMQAVHILQYGACIYSRKLEKSTRPYTRTFPLFNLLPDLTLQALLHYQNTCANCMEHERDTCVMDSNSAMLLDHSFDHSLALCHTFLPLHDTSLTNWSVGCNKCSHFVESVIYEVWMFERAPIHIHARNIWLSVTLCDMVQIWGREMCRCVCTYLGGVALQKKFKIFVSKYLSF